MRRNERRFLAKTRLQPLKRGPGGRSRGRGIRKPAFAAAVSASGISSSFGLGHITGSMIVSEFGRSPFTLLKLGGGFLYDPRHTCACCDKPIDERFVRRVVAKGHPPPRWCWTCKERRFQAFTAADTIARAYRCYIARVNQKRSAIFLVVNVNTRFTYARGLISPITSENSYRIEIYLR